MKIKIEVITTIKAEHNLLHIDMIDDAGEAHELILAPEKLSQIIIDAMLIKAITPESVGLELKSDRTKKSLFPK